MKNDLKKRIILLAIPLAVGGLATLLSGGMDSYQTVNQPPLSPPGWVFPVVWTVLYLLMGEASYRVLTSGKDPAQIRKALIAYGAQLFLNFLWPLVFFGGESNPECGSCDDAHPRNGGDARSRHRRIPARTLLHGSDRAGRLQGSNRTLQGKARSRSSRPELFRSHRHQG